MTPGTSYIVKERHHYGQLKKITLLELTELTYLIDFEDDERQQRMNKNDFARSYKIIEIIAPQIIYTKSTE